MKFGDFEIFLIEDGDFRLDGGAMFGVVPKMMWQKSDPADDRNRIQLSANCLLVKTPEATVLIDTGLGGKWDDKKRDMFAVAEPRLLMSELARCDVLKEDVTHVVQSHLHFDHAGGGTYIDGDGELKVQFPNAKYYAQRGEWEIANNPNLRDRMSYLPENLHPLNDAEVLELVDGDVEVVPGIRYRVTGGHTKHHAIVYIESGGHTAVFNADLIPTASHVHVPYVMGYDLYPQETMDFKTHFLPEVHEGNYLMIFEHGPKLKAGHLTRNDKGKWVVKKFDMEQMEYSVQEDN
ncbi:MBL fold metallo-hydrolase [bacterium]|nr:MBL fold metallo-hydrolase [bacterium]